MMTLRKQALLLCLPLALLACGQVVAANQHDAATTTPTTVASGAPTPPPGIAWEIGGAPLAYCLQAAGYHAEPAPASYQPRLNAAQAIGRDPRKGGGTNPPTAALAQLIAADSSSGAHRTIGYGMEWIIWRTGGQTTVDVGPVGASHHVTVEYRQVTLVDDATGIPQIGAGC